MTVEVSSWTEVSTAQAPFKIVSEEMAVMFEGSLIIALTGVCTGSWDRKRQYVSRSVWWVLYEKKKKKSVSNAVIKPEIKKIHLIHEASSSRGGLLFLLLLLHLFLPSSFPVTFSQPMSLLGLELPTFSPKCHGRASMIVSEAMCMQPANSSKAGE